MGLRDNQAYRVTSRLLRAVTTTLSTGVRQGRVGPPPCPLSSPSSPPTMTGPANSSCQPNLHAPAPDLDTIYDAGNSGVLARPEAEVDSVVCLEALLPGEGQLNPPRPGEELEICEASLLLTWRG